MSETNLKKIIQISQPRKMKVLLNSSTTIVIVNNCFVKALSLLPIEIAELVALSVSWFSTLFCISTCSPSQEKSSVCDSSQTYSVFTFKKINKKQRKVVSLYLYLNEGRIGKLPNKPSTSFALIILM